MKLQIKIDGKTYQAEVEVLEEELGDPALTPHSPPTPTDEPAPGAYVPCHVVEEHSASEKKYLSPVTGLVIKLNVKPGQFIQCGDTLLVLEAMKMETTITAHHTGKVKCVNAVPGAPVKAHQVLVEME